MSDRHPEDRDPAPFDAILDFERLPYELARAVEGQGLPLEDVTGPLSILPDSENVRVFDATGAEIGAVPTYRLREVDAGLLLKASAAALDRMVEQDGVGLADQIQAAISAQDRIELQTPPDEDAVFLTVAGFPLAAIHRRVVVAGWPEDQ